MAPTTAYPYVDAITTFGRGLGAARSGEATAARQEATKLQTIRERLLEAKDTYWAEQTEILRRAVAAWAGRDDQAAALQLMRSAADMEDVSIKHIAMEDRLVPMRELLGELLVEAGQPGAALREFEQSLQNAPNRFRSFYGAAQAAERAGDTAKARGVLREAGHALPAGGHGARGIEGSTLARPYAPDSITHGAPVRRRRPRIDKGRP